MGGGIPVLGQIIAIAVILFIVLFCILLFIYCARVLGPTPFLLVVLLPVPLALLSLPSLTLDSGTLSVDS